MRGVLLSSLIFLIQLAGSRWIGFFFRFCDIVYFDTSIVICDILFARGSAPEPGIWNFGNLTGESNYVGVVKNAYKGSRLDIRWREYVLTFWEYLFWRGFLADSIFSQAGVPDRVCKAFQSFNWVRTFGKLRYFFVFVLPQSLVSQNMNLQVRLASNNLLGRVPGSGQRGSKSTTGQSPVIGCNIVLNIVLI